MISKNQTLAKEENSNKNVFLSKNFDLFYMFCTFATTNIVQQKGVPLFLNITTFLQ